MTFLMIVVIVLALGFDLTNGIRDSSNIVATMISSRSLQPRTALIITAMAEFAGAFNDKLNATIVDGKSDGAWPISGYTYIILHTTSMTDCVKAQKIIDFLKWDQADPAAQKAAATLGYSVLPDAVRTSVLAKLAEVTCNGQPLK